MFHQIYVNTLDIKIPKTINYKKTNIGISFSDYQNLKKSSVVIEVGEYEEGLGSGVLVHQSKKHLYILTAKHVINDQEYIKEKIRIKEGIFFFSKVKPKNIFVLKNQDLAILKISKPKFIKFEIAKIGQISPNITDKIYVIGHPTGLEYTFSEERVTNFTNKWLVISALNIFGSSGSPVYNEKFEKIGIVSNFKGIYDEESDQYMYILHMVKAVKTEHLQKLLTIAVKG